MQLFLASSLDKIMPLMWQKIDFNSNKSKVLFITNAADPYSDPWWVELDRRAFTEAGCTITELDLRTTTAFDLKKIILKNDIIHFCGGSVIYLLSLLQRQNLREIIVEIIKSGEAIYTGTSAGSMITAPSLKLIEYEPEEEEHSHTLTDWYGLGLAPFLILPHSNQVVFAKDNQCMVAHAYEDMTPLLLLQDNQAVWIRDGQFEIVKI